MAGRPQRSFLQYLEGLMSDARTCDTMTVEKAAERLGISRNAAYEAARRGDLPSLRIGRRIVVPAAAFEAWLQSPGRVGVEA